MDELSNLAFELADAAVNSAGYADNADESDFRAVLRDKLQARLLEVVQETLASRNEV